MRHPLQNPSLAPVGFCGSISQKRIWAKPFPAWGYNRELAISKFWAGWNRQNATRPLPVEVIIHEILPSMGTRFRMKDGEFSFEGKQYVGRDIAVLSSVVRWLGSGVGDCFLFDRPVFFEPRSPDREFLEKFAQENVREAVLRECTHHACTKACERKPDRFHPGVLVYGAFDPHDYGPVMERDRALVDGLMWWLGKHHGRAFIAAWQKKRDRMAKAAQARFISNYPDLRHLRAETAQGRTV